MWNWFKKKELPPPKRHLNSLMSTDAAVDSWITGNIIPGQYDALLKLSFQREITSFVPKLPNGETANVVKPAPQFAMDAFAMDQPSEGNTQALKPLIEPLNNIPWTQLCWYAAQGFIGYQICSIISQHWLVDKACTMPARDAMRHGYDITFNDGSEVSPQVMNQIKKFDKMMRVKQNCVEIVRFNRIFGIRIVMFIIKTKDKDFYTNPFNIDAGPKSYMGISQIDPYWITPELDFQAGANPAAPDFYEPTWWRINGMRVHRSHLIVLRNGEVPDILKPSYLYGGISIPQKIAERVYAAERTANEAPQLAMTKRTTVWKMDITQAIANQAVFEQKMAWFSATRDNYGVKAIGLDDEVEQIDTALSDFDELITTQYDLVAAISEVPTSKLLGTLPKGGLGANGDYEDDSYHEFLESLQENDVMPLLERHYLLLNKSHFLGVLPEIEVVFNPVDTPNAKELADINQIKATTAKTYADAGAVDGQDIRTNIIADKDSGWNGMEEDLPEGIEELPETNVRERIDEGGGGSSEGGE